MFIFAISNIFNRKLRSLLCIATVAASITSLLILTGITNGSINEIANRIENIGADMIVQRADSSLLLGLRSGVMPIKIKDQLLNIDGVEFVSSVITWTTKINNQMYVVYGIDNEEFQSIGGKLTLLDGQYFTDDYSIIVDRRFAENADYKTGDSIKFLNRNFKISGICTAGVGARIFMPIKTLQTLLHEENRVSLFFLKCISKDKVGQVAINIEKNIAGVKTQVMENLSSVIANSLTGLNQFISAITMLSLTISILVIILAMYTTILERTHEIGILKSLGASKFYIVNAVCLESFFLSITGVITGYIIAFAIKNIMLVTYPLITITITPEWILKSIILGICVALFGASYPAIKAANLDPVEALRWE